MYGGTIDRAEYVRAEYPEGMAAYLLSGDGFRVTEPTPLGAMWQRALEDLVEAGFMRRSRSGRYWWRTERGDVDLATAAYYDKLLEIVAVHPAYPSMALTATVALEQPDSGTRSGLGRTVEDALAYRLRYKMDMGQTSWEEYNAFRDKISSILAELDWPQHPPGHYGYHLAIHLAWADSGRGPEYCDKIKFPYAEGAAESDAEGDR